MNIFGNHTDMEPMQTSASSDTPSTGQDERAGGDTTPVVQLVTQLIKNESREASSNELSEVMNEENSSSNIIFGPREIFVENYAIDTTEIQSSESVGHGVVVPLTESGIGANTREGGHVVEAILTNQSDSGGNVSHSEITQHEVDVAQNKPPQLKSKSDEPEGDFDVSEDQVDPDASSSPDPGVTDAFQTHVEVSKQSETFQNQSLHGNETKYSASTILDETGKKLNQNFDDFKNIDFVVERTDPTRSDQQESYDSKQDVGESWKTENDIENTYDHDHNLSKIGYNETQTEESLEAEKEEIVFDFDWEDEVLSDIPLSKAPDTITSALELDKELVSYENNLQCCTVMSKLLSQAVGNSFCDVTLCVRDSNYHAHKCVLAANGDYLHSIVQRDQSGLIDLSDVISNSDIFESIIEYLYVGKISISMHSVEDVLLAGKTLGLQDLIQCCSLHIQKSMDLNNWPRALEWSNKFDLADVETSTLDFLQQNFCHVFKSTDFLELNVHTINTILQKCNLDEVTEVEHDKLNMALHWIVHDFEARIQFLPSLIKAINCELITKTGLEKVLGQRVIRCHEIFNREEIAIFVDEVKKNLLQVLKMEKDLSKTETRRPRKSIKPTKLKRLRPRKSDHKQLLQSEPYSDEDHVSNDECTIQAIRGRKRGRPRKNAQPQPKRPRGRPRKYPIEDTEEVVIKQEVSSEDGEEMMKASDNIKEQKTFLHHKTMRLLISKVKKKTRPGHASKPEAFVCLTCGKRYLGRRKFSRHLQIHKEKNILCDLCDYRTSRNDKIKDHFRRVHPVEATERGIMAQEALEQMQAKAARSKYTKKPRAPRIKEEVKEEDMLQCPKCPRKFPSMSLLSHHMKGHGSDTPFLCEVCGFSTRHFASINVHKRQHNGMKFRCQYPGCTYSNIRKSRLEDHMNAHQGVKNHVCSVCGKAFAGRKHMQRHEKLHVEVKPLACDHCEYRSVRRDKLNEHIRKHHPSVAIIMGILDPQKVTQKKLEEESKPARQRKPRKKKIKTEEPREVSLMIDEVVDQHVPGDVVDPRIALPEQHTDQAANYVTMQVPQHLVGASTISEEMIQYLAQMTSSGIVTSHPQIHVASVPGITIQSSNVAPQVQGVTQVVQAVPSPTQAPVAIAGTSLVRSAQAIHQTTDPQGNDTWVYHIVPDGAHQF